MESFELNRSHDHYVSIRMISFSTNDFLDEQITPQNNLLKYDSFYTNRAIGKFCINRIIFSGQISATHKTL